VRELLVAATALAATREWCIPDRVEFAEDPILMSGGDIVRWPPCAAHRCFYGLPENAFTRKKRDLVAYALGNILSADNAVRHRWNRGTTTFEFTALKCCWAMQKAWFSAS